MIVTALVTLAAGVTQVPPAPIEPKTSWQVAYEDGMCLLSRTYGADGGTAIVVRRTPTQPSAAIALSMPADGHDEARFGKVRVGLDPGAMPVETTYRSGVVAGNRRVTIFSLDRDALAALPRARLMAIDLERGASVVLRLSTIAGALQALDGCNRQLLQRWGIDPAEQDRIATPARPRPAVGGARTPMPFYKESYPSGARREGVQGSAGVALTITAEGRLAGCRVVRGSGDERLDAAACRIVDGTRFIPASDTGGKPIASTLVTNVNWSLAGEPVR